jgi:hypothetical protein
MNQIFKDMLLKLWVMRRPMYVVFWCIKVSITVGVIAETTNNAIAGTIVIILGTIIAKIITTPPLIGDIALSVFTVLALLEERFPLVPVLFLFSLEYLFRGGVIWLLYRLEKNGEKIELPKQKELYFGKYTGWIATISGLILVLIVLLLLHIIFS